MAAPAGFAAAKGARSKKATAAEAEDAGDLRQLSSGRGRLVVERALVVVYVRAAVHAAAAARAHLLEPGAQQLVAHGAVAAPGLALLAPPLVALRRRLRLLLRFRGGGCTR